MKIIFNRKHLTKLVASVILGLCAMIHVLGQSPTPTPDPQLEEAKRKQEIAEANKATAEAQRDTYKAIVGELDTSKLPEGKTTAEKTEIEANILAYKAAEQASDKIATVIAGVNPKPLKVVLFSEKEINTVVAYKAFNLQAGLLLTRIAALKNLPNLQSKPLPKPCTGSQTTKFVPPLLAVETALQVMALFKKDTSLSGTSVTLDDFAIYSIIMKKLKEKGISVVYTPFYYPGIFEDPSKQLQVFATFEKLNQSEFSLGDTLDQIVQIKSELTDLLKKENDPSCRRFYESDLANYSDHEKKINEVKSFLSQIITALMKPDEKSGLSVLQQYAVAESLSTEYKSAYLLQLKPIAAGGTSRITTNILGSKLSFGGGAILSFMLTNGNGEYITSGNVTQYGGFVRDSQLNKELK